MVQVLYKGRKRLVHVGKKGGKYVIVEGNKRYLKTKTKPAKTTKSKPAKRKPTKAKPAKKKPAKRKPGKRKTQKPKTLMNYFKMTGGGTTHSLTFINPDIKFKLEEPIVGYNYIVHEKDKKIFQKIHIYQSNRLQDALTASKQKLEELKKLGKKINGKNIEVPRKRLTLQQAYEKDPDFQSELDMNIYEAQRKLEIKEAKKKRQNNLNNPNTKKQEERNVARRNRVRTATSNPASALPQTVRNQIVREYQSTTNTPSEKQLKNNFLSGIDGSSEEIHGSREEIHGSREVIHSNN